MDKSPRSCVFEFRNGILTLLTVSLLVISTGCLPIRQARVAAVALTMQDVGRAAAKQSDPAIVRQGTPAYLMLVDGLIESYPKNKDLLLAGCQAYSSYASSFLAEEAGGEAESLYRKAKIYGFRALSDRGDFEKAASGNLQDFTAFLQKYKKKDVPALFWTANAWASWISANMASVEAMADLPAIEAVMKRILELDDTFYHGGPHLLMGVYLAAKPSAMGGSLPKAKEHFERAFSLGSDKILMARVFYAQYYARGVNDPDLYKDTLKGVLDAPADEIPELTLANVIAKEKAGRLLDKTEEYFEDQL